jgi:pyruvate dehydrogenase E1 component alpha subunit
MKEKDKIPDLEPLKVLDPEGKPVGKEIPNLEDEDLLSIYRWMYLTRIFDERCLKLQRQGRLGTYAPCSGQEGSHVGSAYALRDQDWIFPSYREPGSLMKHGLPMHYIIALWQGNEEGSRIPDGVNVFTYSVPIATQLLHAVGFSLAAKYRGEDLVSLVYFGDGGTSEGDFHEGLNFAGVFKTPTVFFCNNNQYAISNPWQRQTASGTLAQKAFAYGFEGVRVDGMDVLAVYEATRKAVEKASNGGGPTLIEAVNYRFGPHTTADDPTRYRTEEEVEKWRAQDPLIRMKKLLDSKKIWDDTREEELESSVKEEIASALEAAERLSENRDVEEMFKYLYEEMTPQLEEQLQSLREEGR